MISRIRNHNKPLYDAMIAKGYNFFNGDSHAHFIDKDGKYVPYPVGYITGPCYCLYDLSFFYRKQYISVQGKNGWWQRQFLPHELEKTIDWAIETANKEM